MDLPVPVRYISSKRNGKLVLYNGYIYRVSKKNNENSYYKCSKGCKDTLVVRNDFVTDHRGEHVDTHLPDSNTVTRKKAVETLKVSVESKPYLSLPKLYKETVLSFDVNENTAGTIPNFRSVQSIMYRQRLKDYPKLPKSLSEVHLPPTLKLTLSGKNFLICDEMEQESRMLIFSTTDNLKILCDSYVVYADGTFKIAPSLFCQLYTLHGTYMGELVPLVFALLPNKKTETYINMLRSLKTVCTANGLNFSPTTFKTDFEAAVFNAIAAVLPGTDSSGCLFHFSQAIVRKVQKLGLVSLYKNDEEVQKCIKRLFGLSLLPLETVEDAFQAILESAPSFQQMTQMLDYILENFIGDPGMGITERFDRHIWNHFHDMSDATNNKLEGWHFGMNQRFSGKHPNVFAFLIELRKEQDYQEKRCKMLIAGQSTTRKSRKWENIQNRREKIKSQYLAGQRTIMEYLDAIKNVFHFD